MEKKNGMTTRTNGLRRFARAGAAALLMVAGTLAAGGVAQALPPDGPGPESPGTSSRVWPTEVRVGDTLNFEVSGYPANETVYIKIDDGTMCTDTSHGACVYATQKLDGNGYASGSIVVPELPEGGHWLRMLATGDVFDSKTGEKLGYEGYTRRGGNDFTVVGGGSGGGSGAGGAASSGAAGGASAAEGGDVEGGSVSLDVGEEESEKLAVAESGGTSMDDITVDVEKEDGETVAAAPVSSSGPSVPMIGIGVLAAAVVLGGGGVTWALIRRRKLMQAAAAPAAGAGE